MAKTKSPVMLTLGLIVAITATVTFGLVNIEVLNNTIKPLANWIFVGGFVAVYLLSDREIGKLDDHEAVALILPLLLAIGSEQMSQVSDFINEYNPIAGFVLVGITLIGFYALSTDMDIRYMSLEMVLGAILAVTASVQFDVLSIEVLNNHITQISVWVFVIALTLAYLVSERELGRMSQIELGALAIGIGGYVGYEYIPEVQSAVDANNPVAGVILVAVTILAYYFIMNNGSLTMS